jgi:hypothetical protein
MMRIRSLRLRWCRLARQGPAIAALAGAACTHAAPPPAPGAGLHATAVPVYDTATGRLRELDSDRNGDGKIDTRAFMDGVTLLRIEIDRNGDGRPDRWEFYTPAAAGPGATGRTVIDHAEEANGPSDTITRREFYTNGQIARVEEDTDNDGHVDKWEQYEGGVLTTVALDLQGAGRPDRRLVYGPDGNVERIEADPDGDGVFSPVIDGPGGAPARQGGR